MLTIYQHFTNDRKDWRILEASMNFLSWEQRSKRIGRRKKKFSKQNVCVSSQNIQYEKRRGRYRSGYTLPSPQLAVSQAGPAAFFHGVIQIIGKTPLTTTNVLPFTPAIFRQLKQRCRWVWEQTKNIRM